MRIKINGENNCARATRHLLRLAGFAVTESLPGDAVAAGPLAGYAITIDLAPAQNTPDAFLRPDPTTQHPHTSAKEEAPRSLRDASSPSFAESAEGEGDSGETVARGAAYANAEAGRGASDEGLGGGKEPGEIAAELVRGGANSFGSANGLIHFDSVDSALETAVLRHVTQLAGAPVIVDRPGGVVHSDRELRIVAPNSGDAQADEAAAVAIEFGVLRGLLDLTAPGGRKSGAGAEDARKVDWRRKWWPFGALLLAGGLGLLRGSVAAAPGRSVEDISKTRRLKPALLAAQGQFATGEGFKITDGINFLVVDPCMGSPKLFASINQTGNAQIVAGTGSEKIYVCSIHVVAAVATDVAVVEGTGTVCVTSTTGVSGFGGATAATGWNFAANGGIVLGNGDSSLGVEVNSGDNLCIFNSGSGQVSGGISYVVQ